MEQGEKSFIEAVEEKKLPGTLNVLTILTFIFCGLGFIGALWGFGTAKQSYDAMDKLINGGDLDKLPAMLRGMYNQDMLEVLRKNLENRLPILIISLISVGLSFYGALKMRQLKMEGYISWMIAQAVPYLGSFLFIGAVAFRGGAVWIGIVIVLIFVSLYTSQRKHLS